MNRIISKFRTAASLAKTPQKLLLPAGQNGLLNFMPDKMYLKAVFKAETGYALDLNHPQTYNEKLQWIKLYDRKPEYVKYADKYKVREYIATKLGEKYLVPLIGMYKRAEDIPWSDLPNRFVLKCNHASGTNIICKNKADLDKQAAEKKLNAWLKKNAFWGGREWCYKNIVPCIICEEFIETQDGNTPDDYKVMCFNGVPRLIQVHHDRYGDHTLDFMDTNWEKTSIVQGPHNSKDIPPKPNQLDEILDIACVLSKDMLYARIDLYIVNDTVKFGEITMYPTGGFSIFNEHKTDILLGSWLKLPIDP